MHADIMHADIIVIGAGAAGLMAADTAARRGRQVLLLEKNNKPGAKILMSGGTRCNITQAVTALGIVEAFGKSGPFLHSALAALSPERLIELLEAEGVATKVEPPGKVFPKSDKAADVLAALLRRLETSGARLITGNGVVNVLRRDDNSRPDDAARFVVQTETEQHTAQAVILTTGGQSYPGCGTTGDGYAWAKAFGHRIIPPRPALVPFTTNEAWIPPLRGVTVPDVQISLHESGTDDSSDTPARERERNIGRLSKPIDQRRGSFLFTHFGLSGPAILDLSSRFTAHPLQKTLAVCCDFLPAIASQELEQRLVSLAGTSGARGIEDVVAADLPRRLIESLVRLAGIPLKRRVAELTSTERQALIVALKQTVIPIAGTLGFKKAEVTAGGVDLAEVDSRSLESKVCRGLFLAGEILDLHGPIGGYNFQAAFSTGYLAGANA